MALTPKQRAKVQNDLKKPYLNEGRLYHFLAQIPKCTFIYNDQFGNYTPGFICYKLKIIIEFDGPQHYISKKAILSDNKKDLYYKNLGYRIIRIPYFIQLTKQSLDFILKTNQLTIKLPANLAEILKEYQYPHGFIDENAPDPTAFCEMGADKFHRDFNNFTFAQAEILESLKARIDGSDINHVLPGSLKNLIV